MCACVILVLAADRFNFLLCLSLLFLVLYYHSLFSLLFAADLHASSGNVSDFLFLFFFSIFATLWTLAMLFLDFLFNFFFICVVLQLKLLSVVSAVSCGNSQQI